MKLFIYTFRTFPNIEGLRAIFPELKVFGKLKEDIKQYESEISEADLVIGIAATRGHSVFESRAVNKFGKRGVINKNGPKEYGLVNLEWDFKRNEGFGTSFCNWSAYKAVELNRCVGFIHINPKDIKQLNSLIKKIP